MEYICISNQTWKKFDETKRERIEAKDETNKIVEGSNKGGIASVNDNHGENMASDNACVLNEFHLRILMIYLTNTQYSLKHKCIVKDQNYRASYILQIAYKPSPITIFIC